MPAWRRAFVSGKNSTLNSACPVAQVASGRDSVTDIYSTGKSMFFAMIMVVTLEIGLLARYWTWPFVIICFLSYTLVGPCPGAWFMGCSLWRMLQLVALSY